MGGAIGVLAGGITGAIIGGFTQSDRWVVIPVQVSTVLAPSYKEQFGLYPGVRIRIPVGK